MTSGETSQAPLSAAVFASGGGSNFESLVRHSMGEEDSAWQVSLLLTDRPGIGALERARVLDVPHRVLPVVGRPAEEVEAEMLGVLEEAGVDLILLAGFLRLVPPGVVRAFRGRILNIHPALLPAFGGKGMYGLRIHQAVLDAGVRVTGVTVHRVEENYDDGRILAQWPVPVLPGDDAPALAARVLEVEHRLYPRVTDLLAARICSGGAPDDGLTEALSRQLDRILSPHLP